MESSEKKTGKITSKPVIAGALLVMVANVLIFIFLADFIKENGKDRRKLEVKHYVNSVRNIILPVATAYKRGQLSKKDAIDSIRHVLYLLTYEDPTEKGYVFFGGYNGMLYVQPFNPENENHNLMDTQDRKGKYFYREIVNTAKSAAGSGYVDYIYLNPSTRKEEEKISFITNVPEMECFLGAGVYMSQLYSEQKRIVWTSSLLTVLLLVLFFIPIYMSLGRLRKQNLLLEQEIEEKKTARHESEIDRQRLAIALESLQYGLWEWYDFNTDLLLSPEYYMMLGYMPGEFKPDFDTIRRMVHPDDRPAWMKSVNEVIENSDSPFEMEFRMKKKDGSWIWVLNKGKAIERDATGKAKKIIGLNSDITKRKEYEKSIAASEKKMRITLESIGDAVFAIDVDGTISKVNPEAVRITGVPESELIGNNINDMVKLKNEEESKIYIENLNPEAMPGGAREIAVVSRSGEERDVSLKRTPIIDNEGNLWGFVFVLRDITEQNMIENRLRQAQKMELIGQLAGGVAHDFNNLLTGIIGANEVLSALHADSARSMKLINIINSAAYRAADLTKKMLTFSRKGKILSTPVDVHVVIMETIELLERSIDKRIAITSDLAADDSFVVGDPTLLQGMFLNIALNSRDAMPEGGSIKFRSRNMVINEEFKPLVQFNIIPGRYLELSIIDNGIGMTKEVMERIFEPFFTTKIVGKGTGLGLSAVYGVVKDHHGAINIDSEPGMGTAFQIYLPLSEYGPRMNERVTYNDFVGSGLIMVVDDESILRSIAEEQLTEMGFTVILAEDGREAVETYRKMHGEIKAVILDVVMPKMNGEEALKEMLKINPAARVAMASGFTRDASLKKYVDEKSVAFLQKPFRREELIRVLKQLLSE